MIWRYVDRDRIKEYESQGWMRADLYQTTRNPYFVLMLWDKAHGH